MVRETHGADLRGLRFRHPSPIAELSCAGSSERRRYHQHLAQCAPCRLDSARRIETLVALAALCPAVAPPKGLKRALQARIRKR